MTMMPNWLDLLEEASLAAVLPRQDAHFARPIREGLALFLQGLRPEEQRSMLSAQAALPFDASISQRLGLLARSSPVLQKLGQVLARDRRLAPELRTQLRQLESLAPTVPVELIERILRHELGSIFPRHVNLAPAAIAEASVAVVIPFEQTDPAGRRPPRRGVFKVLKPGIEDRLMRELVLLRRVGEHFDERCDELGLPQISYQELFRQVHDRLLDEVHLGNEQRHLREASRFFAQDVDVVIPEVFDHCTERVTAMQCIEGHKIAGNGGDVIVASQSRLMAKVVARAMIARPVFSRADPAIFHGDPHAGNLFRTDDGKLAILDWSLVGRLSNVDRDAIIQVMLGAVAFDARQIAFALERWTERSVINHATLYPIVKAWLRQIRYGKLPGVSWLVGLLDDATQHAGLRVGPEMMLFRKSLHTLCGVLGDMAGDATLLDDVMFAEFVKHFAIEWPFRFCCLPASREFATRLSNLDLTRTLLSSPSSIARYWTSYIEDLLSCGETRERLESICP